ncbi:DUF4159 domain-containing protein [uncultured Algimonas sp.]|uniref:DUF4159 domain-containing protein n=1 Tax=uncultured Algimonas sp. TaxID=1547920 RepID=UPI002631B3C1|nr:DUF4159 domain-containing protein [uncultured Algimonas sp.]
MSGLTLLAPLTLIGLLTLPLVWWILKVSPPAPKRRLFPALSILKGVETDEETPNATPLWVLLYRLLMVALAVFALSLPLLQSGAEDDGRPLTLVIDDSAAAAPVWSDMMDEARHRVRDAQRRNLDVVLITGETERFDAVPAAEALQRLRSASPRLDTAPATLPDLPPGRDTVFLSSGVGFGDDDALQDRLQDAGALVVMPDPGATVIVPGAVRETADGFETDWFSAHAPRTAVVDALSPNGDVLSSETLGFAPGRSLATASISLPPQLRSRVTRLRIAGMRAGAATKLLDDSFGRPLVGVLAPPSGTSSPLLSEDFYAEQALGPFADLFIGDPETVLSLNPTVLVMPDSMSSDATEIIDFVEAGGILIRFAGPQLAEGDDTLSPVPLRRGGRSIGGALAWETPQALAPFASESPFAGLAVPADVTVSRQVMASPGAETDAATWARLEDGSPVVTSAARGEGRIVLFHVTAGPEWSNLAISGLYIDMLKRILPLAKSRRLAPSGDGGAWTLDRLLGPFGELRPPPPQPVTVADADWDTAQDGLSPGYYRSGTRQRAVQPVANPEDIAPFGVQGLRVERMDGAEPRSLAGLLLAAALVMLALDMLVSALMSGRWRPAGAVAAALVAVTLVSVPTDGLAQDRVRDAALGLHLAYVETGDGRTDDLSRIAMESLSRELTRRTTIEPVGVHGVAPDSEGLVMYPFLYWPVRLDTPALSETERVSINNYIAAGGTLVLDTADEAERSFRGDAAHPGLARVTDGLNIGRLARVPDDHVLTKSFYLSFVFPGRWANGPVYVEADGATQGGRDGVSAVIIGSNDWASGWALDETTGPLVDLSNDIPRQREMAIRFGVNVAMYTLSGNYKADQVHAKELIERLGMQNR